jgi:hypothetical protein
MSAAADRHAEYNKGRFGAIWLFDRAKGGFRAQDIAGSSVAE